MKPLIFSIDTSSRYIVLSLGDDSRFIAGQAVLAERSHQARLHPLIKRFLKSARVGLKDIACFGVVAGPGSFTGLRIGISAVKGFAWALKKPVAAVSALDCLAQNLSGAQCGVSPVIDAKRSLVYTGRYKSVRGGWMRRQGAERAVLPQQWVKSFGSETVFLGDGVERYPHVFGSGGPVKFKIAGKSLWHIRPVSLWQRSCEAFKARRFVKTMQLEPVYLRLPEAVEVRHRKRNNASRLGRSKP